MSIFDFIPGKKTPPLRCDVCGKFIGYAELDSGDATHMMITPDSDLSFETFETICKKCKTKYDIKLPKEQA